ncbi:MAG TPA: TonB-dependent receptor [Chitinophagaceae bacterium]|nr:TonB-dependent receptor [Chitinophagaceae bacterium]
MSKQTAICRSVFMLTLLFLLSLTSFSQTSFKVSGKVFDENGKPVEGATVQVKGTTIATSTIADGSYSLMAPSGTATLVITSVGFTQMEVAIANKEEVIVHTSSIASALQDVVVIGYTTVKRKDVTGAVGGINQKDIKSRPVDNALQAMQGKVAGVDIGSNERPGTIPSINIRGVRSLTASNTPLFVVDGIPLITGSIDNINPQDIESIDVLKDASATAIYGSRGANGVVIITTKQAKAGKMTLSLNSSFTLDQLVDNEEKFNASDFITFRRWAYYYAGLNTTTGVSTYPRGDQPDINRDKVYFSQTADKYAWANIAQGWASGTWDGSKVATTDWRGMVTQQSMTTDNILSVSGGTDKIKAYGSFGYLNNKGTIKGQSFERYTARSNIDIAATKWLSFGTNLNFSYGTQQYGQSGTGVSTVGNPQGGLYESARANFPFAVPYDSAGNRISFPGGDNAIKTIVDEWKYNIDERVTLRAFGSLYAQVDFGSIAPILKGLKYRLNFGPDLSYFRDGVYIDKNSVANGGSSSYASLTKTSTYSYTLDNLLYYDRTIGQHTFGLTLLQSATGYTQETSNSTGLGVPLSSQLWNALTSGTVTGTLSTSSNIIEQQLTSYMARLNYSFKDKYLLTVSARQDGSSVLAEGHKYSWFPSAALAWRISKEGFMNGLGWINDLKLRIGAGVTGNSAIAPYATQGPATSLFYPFYTSSTAGSIPNSTLANQELGWEKTTQYNIGVDFSLFKNRISGSVDVYTSNTSDLLLQRNIPTVTGFNTTFANIGETANTGVDITLTTVNVRQKDLTWTTTTTAAWQKEHIVTLSNGKQNDISNTWFIDQPIGVIYGYKALGLWQPGDKTEMQAFNANGNAFSAGNVRVEDVNGDHKIDGNNDRQIIGWTRPRWIVGMTNTVTYKQLEFSIFLYGRLNYMYNYGGETEPARYVTREVNYYTENNPNAEFQKPIFNAGGAPLDPYYASLGYLHASFIKIRNISLGYNFKPIAKAGVSNLRIYFQVQNPGMLYSQIKFRDMDVVSPTWNRGYTLGINASF